MPETKKYSVIYADPPWRYDMKRGNGVAENHYPTMSIDELCALPVAEIAAPDSALFMWATFPQLPEALRLIKAWGFTYKTVAFVWLKKNKKADSWFYGLGFWTRGNAEICLLAKKLYPEQTAKRPDLIPESVKNGCNVYSLCKMMEVRTGEKFTYQQMTDFYNGKPLDVKRMETPDGVQKDKAVRFDKEKQDFSFSAIRQERKKGLRM